MIFGLFALADLSSLWSANRVDIALRTLVQEAEGRRQATSDMRGELAAIAVAARQTIELAAPSDTDSLRKSTGAFEAALAQYGARAATDRGWQLTQQASTQYERLKRRTEQLAQLADERRETLHDVAAHLRNGHDLLYRMPLPAVPPRESISAQRLGLAKDVAAMLRTAVTDLGQQISADSERLSVAVRAQP